MDFDYYSQIEVESALKALVAAYPALCELVTLPNVTEEGKTVLALRIRDVSRQQTGGALIMGCAHGNEWGGAEICVGLAADLLKAYWMQTGMTYGGKKFFAWDIAQIVETLDVLVLPVVNPDGREYSLGGDETWRKNRSRAASQGNEAWRGVDINRNYDFLWSAAIQSSNVPASPRFHGTKAESEPEVLNVKWLLDNFPLIDRLMDIHSASAPTVIWGWGDDEIQSIHHDMNFLNPWYDGLRGGHGDWIYREFMPANDASFAMHTAQRVAAAINVAGKNAYTLIQGSIYQTGVSGLASDYCYSRSFVNPNERKIFGFGIEFGVTTPEWDNDRMLDNIASVDAGLVEFLRLATEKATVKLPHRVDFFWRIIGLIPADGGGAVIPPGGFIPIPVPPPPPFLELLELLPPEVRATVRSAWAGALAHAIEEAPR